MSKRFLNPALFGPWCLVLLMLLILRLSTPAPGQAQGQVDLTGKRVLILHEIEYNVPILVATNRALIEVLEAGGIGIRNQFYENLDFGRNPEPEHRKKVAELLRQRYSNRPVDLIITTYAGALKFALDEGRTIFPQAPIIALYLAPGMEISELNRIIIRHSTAVDPSNTLESALKLLPKTKQVYVVSGAHINDKRLENVVRQEFKKWESRLEFFYLNNLPMEKILATVSSLPENSIVLLPSLQTDVLGTIFTTREAIQRVSQASNAPVFGLVDVGLGYGLVGGYLISYELMGRKAGELGLEILRSGIQNAASYPKNIEVRPVPMYDGRQLQRWNLDENSLPKGSIVINKEFTLWDLKYYIIAVVAFLLLETALIIFLVVQRRRRILAEKSLRQKTEELDQFFNVSLDLLCIAKTEGYFLRLNPAWERILGYSREELMAKRFLDFVHPDDLDRTHEAISMLASQQKVFYFENRYRCKDGTYRWLEWSASPAGKLIYAAARDVTERKQAEEALEDRLRFEGLVSHLSARFVNIPPDRVDPEIGQSLKQIIDFFKVDRCALLQILADETSWQITHVAAQESVPPVPQGTTLPVSINPWAYDKLIRKQEVLSVSRIDDLPAEANVDKQTWNEWGIRSNLNIPIILGGPVNHVFAINSVKSEHVWPKESIPRLRLLGEIFVNALERKRAEQKAYDAHRELTRMERLSQMGELSASLSHELNQPLTAILSNASAALRFLEAGKLDPAELVEILQDIVKDDKRAGDIIRNLRAMVKPEEGEQELISINGVLRETVALFRSEAIIRNIRVEIDLADPLPLLYVTKVQIQQVLINLMMNAAESMTGDEYAEKVIVLQTAASGEGVVKVAVRDFGPGIEEQALERIFDPFFTTKRSGLGMGLSLSRSIIESHGGHIWAENNPDKGITFYFDLPGVKNEGRRVPGVE